MAKWLVAAVAVAVAAPVLPVGTAAAQVQNGTLVIYGDQKCPTNADGEEIVVCVRRPAEEQFRIPQELRELEVTPENQSWAVRQESALQAGESGIGSCSAIGAGGATGCFVRNARAAKAQNRARQQAESAIPLP